MIITHGAGGSVDIPSRGIAQYMPKYLGVPVICENTEGAGGRRAMEFVFNQAKPDGYTMVASAFPSRLIGASLYDSKYKTIEFVHLGVNHRSMGPFQVFKRSCKQYHWLLTGKPMTTNIRLLDEESRKAVGLFEWNQSRMDELLTFAGRG
jgi:hypothetical protein